MKSEITNRIKELEDIVEKIKTQSVPTERDKDMLQYKLNRQVHEEEHLHIFTEVVKYLGKKNYSMTDNGTLFDLNDLSPEAFWKIYYHAQLAIHNQETAKLIEKAQTHDEAEKIKLSETMKTELSKFQDDPDNAPPDDLDSLSPYEKLRYNALSQCQYSTYAQKTGGSDYSLALTDDKRMEKTIYSDTFQHRWKSDAPAPLPAPKLKLKPLTAPQTTQPPPTQISPEVEADVGGDGDYDDMEGDDDMMINDNDNYVDDEGEDSEIEIDRLKAQLLKMPKLNLKVVTPMNYDEIDD